ncbi:MAG: TraB/TrbI/VirB10 family type IV secretion system protein [Burkholderiales bacterium]
MSDKSQGPTATNERLLKDDVNGGGAKSGISIKGTPRLGGARLSKNFKKIAFIGGGAIAGGMLIGVMTAGNKAPPAEGDGASSMVGQTAPDTNAMMRAAEKHAAATGAPMPRAGASSPSNAGASSPGAALGTPGAALASNGPPSKLTPAQKYQEWLVEQHYKDMEGEVLASQSANLAKTNPQGAGMMGGGAPGEIGGVASATADALRQLTKAQANSQGGTTPDVARALAALQGGGGGLGGPGSGRSPQGENKAFLADQENKGSNGYLDAAVQPPISNHELFAGSVIPAVMLTGIDSDLPGTITAQVRQTVYDSLNPDVVLIPQGTRVVGAYSSDVAYGQSRVLVAWNRLIFPNGAMIDLKGMSGTDGIGQAGLHDQVDNHAMKIFGSAVLMSLLGVAGQLSQPQNAGALNTPSTSQQAAAALAQQMDSVGTNLLNKNLSIQPTLQIRPGYAFNVLVNRTMILPPYPGK